MSGIDVRDLAGDELPSGGFPAGRRSDFRLHMSPEVHQGTWEHAKKDTSVEVCGVLVGRWEKDDDGPFATVTGFIQCDNASSKFAEVTFTHESWCQINHEMDTRFSDDRIVGWYHTHPDFGVFLSDRDCFIHENFFSGPGQVAYVIDPVREEEAVFAWREGKPLPLPYFWIGDSMQLGVSSESPRRQEARRGAETAALADAPETPAPRSRLSSYEFPVLILTWLLVFVLGYLLSGVQSRWEKEMTVKGVAAHYGYNKLIKYGLKETLDDIRKELTALSDAVDHLPKAGADLSEEEVQQANRQLRMITAQLKHTERRLEVVQEQYAFSDAERQVLLGLMVQKQKELQQLLSESAKRKPPRADAKAGGGGPPPEKRPDPPATEEPHPPVEPTPGNPE